MKNNWDKIITTVRTPLAFFAMTLLLGNSTCVVLIKTTTPPLQYFFSGTFIIYLFTVLITVIVFANKKPWALKGEYRPTLIASPPSVRAGDTVVTIAPKPQTKTIIANQEFIRWNNEMYQYTGEVTEVATVNASRHTCTIKSDEGRFDWRFEWLVKLKT